MPKNYSQLIENVKTRSNPGHINESQLFKKSFSDELGKISSSGSKVLEYIRRSMKSVEQQYTSNTIEAGNKVSEHLRNNNPLLDFKYQGSVMSNTHIKGYSDIDLVQITSSFYSRESKDNFQRKYHSTPGLSYQQSQKLLDVINDTPYVYSPVQDLQLLRADAERVLINVYKNVNIKKSKSIEVNPTNPNRIVDVVTASWYKTVDSEFYDQEIYRGIQIYDKESNTRLNVDYPFLKIHLLDQKNKDSNNRLKKMIRFLKTLKGDSEYELRGFSSFDICSVCYNIPLERYDTLSYYMLVNVLYEEFKKIAENETYRNSIKSIDGTEHIFYNKQEKLRLLKLLQQELSTIYFDLLPQLSSIKFL